MKGLNAKRSNLRFEKVGVPACPRRNGCGLFLATEVTIRQVVFLGVSYTCSGAAATLGQTRETRFIKHEASTTDDRVSSLRGVWGKACDPRANHFQVQGEPGLLLFGRAGWGAAIARDWRSQPPRKRRSVGRKRSSF